ncbi:MAG: hypothetical protein WEE89_04890 [Gemmatimonadota bacterium]
MITTVPRAIEQLRAVLTAVANASFAANAGELALVGLRFRHSGDDSDKGAELLDRATNQARDAIFTACRALRLAQVNLEFVQTAIETQTSDVNRTTRQAA